MWDYEKVSAPFKRGEKYYFYKNEGLQNQSVLYSSDELRGEEKVILDPNTFSEDGTVALSGTYMCIPWMESWKRRLHYQQLEPHQALVVNKTTAKYFIILPALPIHPPFSGMILKPIPPLYTGSPRLR